MRLKSGHSLVFCLVAAAAATSALAQPSQPAVIATSTNSETQQLLDDHWVLDLGAFVVQSNVRASLNGSLAGNQDNQEIDFDQTFGNNASKTRWRADLLWRITPTQHVRLMYFTNDVTNTRTIPPPGLQWGDYTFNGSVTAETRLNVVEGVYEWTFLHARDYHVAAQVGVHFDDVRAQLSGQATVTNPNPPPPTMSVSGASKAASVPAPLPVIGVRGDWAATDHLMVDASGQIFGVSYNGINGNWTDIRAGLTWMFSHHFGVGLAYDRFYTHVKLDKDNFNGRLAFGYQGALLYLRGGW
jgi:hypothetical protein